MQNFLTIFVPLVIILDPLGNLPLFLLFTEQNTPAEQERTAIVSCLAAAAILIFFGLTGDFVLRFLGISLPAFQIAGGFIFFIYALQMLRLIPSGIKTSAEEKQEGVAKENVTLVPLATPLLAGPGAITAVMVQQQSNPDNIFLLLPAIVAACFLVYAVFHFGKELKKFLGVGGIRVFTRLMGLLLAVIAVQFIVSGFEKIG